MESTYPTATPVWECTLSECLGRRGKRMRIHSDALPPHGPHEQHLEAPRAAVVPEEHVDGVLSQRVYQRCVRYGLVPLACEERRRAARERCVDQRTQRLYTVLVVADVSAQHEIAGRQGIRIPIQFFDRHLAPTQGLDPAVARRVSSEEREVFW